MSTSRKAPDKELRPGRRWIGREKQDRGQHERTNPSDPRRQPIHVIEHVERVDQRHDPKDRDDIGNNRDLDEETKLPAEKPNYNPGDGELHRQANLPTEPFQVVQEANAEQDGRQREERPERDRFRLKAGQVRLDEFPSLLQSRETEDSDRGGSPRTRQSPERSPRE